MKPGEANKKITQRIRYNNKHVGEAQVGRAARLFSSQLDEATFREFVELAKPLPLLTPGNPEFHADAHKQFLALLVESPVQWEKSHARIRAAVKGFVDTIESHRGLVDMNGL